MRQRGAAHLLLLILIIIIAVAVILVTTGIIKLPKSLEVLSPKNQFRSYYQNPFESDKESYVNPFSEIGESSEAYKNPFEGLE